MKIRNLIYLQICLSILLSSCITYTEETEKKFQENYAFMQAYQEELGLKNNPFVQIEPKENLDKQRKKQFALMSKEELKAMLDAKASGIPRIQENNPRSTAFFNDIKEIEDRKEIYKILNQEYPDIIVKD